MGTEDFIAFASRVAHQDLTGFLRDWLYGDTVPPMPGHPDWTADPVVEAAPALKAATAAPSARALEHPADAAALVRP
jgi:hypothetical protein